MRVKLKRNKFIITAFLIISILTTSLLAGCIGKSVTTSAPARKYTIVQGNEIIDSQGVKWQIYQLRLTLDGGATFTIDLNLANSDKVDTWYTTEKPTSGGSVNFQVKAGTDVIYTAAGASATATGNTSDRLSFTAATANGTSYRLIFHNNLADKNSKETIFTEIIYPAKDPSEDSIFIPL